jgi:hypothetical protein
MSENATAKTTTGDIWNRFVSFLPRPDWIVVGWVFAIKILLLVLGATAYRILENKRLLNFHSWLAIWNRWDSLHYQQIAQFGYNGTDKYKAWFFPLFPWCTRAVSQLTGDYLVGALLVSTFALLAAAIMLRRIVDLDHSPAVAERTVWFFLIFPTAYFLHAGFTESLFVALVLGSILNARRERWWLAGLLGGLAWMTRANGAILLPTLAVEAIHQLVTTKRWQWRWLWIALVPAGFGGYLLVNYYVTGDPFTSLRMRRELSAASMDWPWVGIREALGNANREPGQGEMLGRQEIFFVALGFVCLIASWFKLRPVYATWLTGSWLLFTCLTFIQSTARYELTMFPIFMIFALATKHRFWLAIFSVWSLIFLGLFASVFVRGWWAF